MLTRAWRAAAPYAVPVLVFAAIILAIFWRAWTPLEGERRAFAWDAQWEYWGDLQYQADALRDGELPLWNPHDRLGYPFHTDPQAGTLYPVQWPLVVGAAIGGATPQWLISIKILLHFEIAALGMFFVLRRRKLPTACCYLGGLIAITGYPMLHNTFSALNWSFAWVPWWLLATDAWVDKPSWTRALGVAVTAALCALAGGWAAFWYGCLVVGPLAIVGLVQAIRARTGAERRAYVRRVLVTGGAALGWFVLLAGAQVVATSGVVGETVRDDRGVKFFGTTVFDAVDIAGFFLPRGQGENTYLGWGPILWVGLCVALRPNARSLTLAGIFGLAVLCAMGDRGPALSSMASIIPPFELFRRAHRYLYVSVIPIAILAAEGLAMLPNLDDATRQRLRRAAIAASGLLVLVCGVGFAIRVKHPWKPDILRDSFGWGIGAGLVGGFTTWLVLAHPKLRAALVIAITVAAIDLWVARSRKVEEIFHAIPKPTNDATAVRLATSAGDPVPRRIYDRGRPGVVGAVVGYRPGVRLHLRDLGGYEGDPLALQRFQRVLDGVRQAPARAAPHAAIAYLFEKEATARGPDAGALRAVEKNITHVTNAIPDVLWLDAAQIVADAGAAWTRAQASPPGTTAFLEAPQLDAALRARLTRIDALGSVAVPGRLLALERNSLRAEIDAPADGVVMIAELYHPRGWSAEVDGRAAPIVAVNGWARGVPVGPGHHTITMTYRATGYVAWGALALAAWIASAAFAIVAWRRRRKLSLNTTAVAPAKPAA